MMTIMGIFAERNELDLTGTTVRVLKEMTLEPPRRIGKLTVDTPLHPQASGGVVAEAMKMQMPAVNNAFDTRPCGIMEIASN